MVGLVPIARKRKTQYPLFSKDPFARESGSRKKYVEPNAASRRAWHEYTDGVRPEVLAIIKDFQPYSFGDRPGHVNLLSALKSLSNADKHYQLSVIPMGLEDPERTISAEWHTDRAELKRDGEGRHSTLPQPFPCED